MSKVDFTPYLSETLNETYRVLGECIAQRNGDDEESRQLRKEWAQQRDAISVELARRGGWV